MPDTSIYSPSSFRKFLEILKRGGKLKVSGPTWQAMNPVVRQTMVFALQEAGGGTVCLSNVLHGSLLAYSTSWEDCSEVVLRLPEASDNKTGTLDPPNGATGRETGQKQGSNESSTPEIEPWDPVMDPLGPRNWSESPKN